MSQPHDAASYAPSEASLLRLIGALSCFALVAIVVQPRSAPLWLAIICGTLIASSSVGARVGQIKMPPLAWALVAFCGYALINCLWAVDRLEALGKVASLAMIAVVVHVTIISLQGLSQDRLAVVGRAVGVSVVVGAVFLAIEVNFDQPIMRMVYDLLPFLRASPKHVRVGSDGTVASIGLYVLNRNLAALDLMLWPGLALLALAFDSRRAALALVVIATALAIYFSEHETSKLALPVAILVFLLGRLSSRLTLGLLTAGWITATLLVVPLTLAAYSHDLHLAKWIPETGRNRIILWGYTADQWRQAPVLGIGVDSTKEVDDQRAATAVKPEGFTYALRTGRHAHNIFMQTWYEMGAIGAILLLSVGLAALAAIQRLSERIKPFAMASFATAAILGAFSWGLWQIWFLALFGLSALLVALANQLERRRTS